MSPEDILKKDHFRHLSNIYYLTTDLNLLLNQVLNRYKSQVQGLENSINQITKDIEDCKSSETKKRLTLFSKVITSNQDYYAQLGQRVVQDATEFGMKEVEISKLSPFMNPIPTIHRDWGYGQSEIKQEFDLCHKFFSEIDSVKEKILFLGSGSCHLTHSLASEWGPKLACALDSSVELILSFDELSKGKSFNIGEEVLSSTSLDTSVCITDLKASKNEKLKLLVGDFFNNPLEEKSFSAVMAPWFLDILGVEPLWPLIRINELLDNDGHFFFMGPLGFQSGDYHKRYSAQELIEIAKNAGFKLLTHNQEEVPYRQLPGIGRKITENLHFMVFQKIKNHSIQGQPKKL